MSRRAFRAASSHSGGVGGVVEGFGGVPVVDCVGGGGASGLPSVQLPTVRPSASRAHFAAPPSCDGVSGGGAVLSRGGPELEGSAAMPFGEAVAPASARRVRSAVEFESGFDAEVGAVVDDGLGLATLPAGVPVLPDDPVVEESERVFPEQTASAIPSAAVRVIQEVLVMAQLRDLEVVPVSPQRAFPPRRRAPSRVDPRAHGNPRRAASVQLDCPSTRAAKE
jgi:hypothetical protein